MFLSALLKAERVRWGTRTGSRALGCFRQAVLILRWYLDGARLAQLAADNSAGKTTAYGELQRLPDIAASGIAILLVEHDVDAALTGAERAYVLENGHITLDGQAASLLAEPKICSAYLGIA